MLKRSNGSEKSFPNRKSSTWLISPKASLFSLSQSRQNITKKAVSQNNKRRKKVTSRNVRTASESVTYSWSSLITNLYKARCKDLSIPVVGHQLEKFANFCETGFKSRRFRLPDLGLAENSAEFIGEILKFSSFFCEMDLSKNNLKDLGVKHLVDGIARNKSLVYLDLSSNNISSEGSEYLFKVLSRQNSVISLKFSSLEGLNRNRVNSCAAKKLCELFKNPIFLMCEIEGVNLGDEGLAYLTPGLDSNLMALNLAKNNISRSIGRFSKALVSSNLVQLNLAHNNIGNYGCKELSSAISEENLKIEVLDLSYNNITDSRSFFLALCKNSSIKNLSLEGNLLKNGLSHTLYQFLCANKFLSTLNLGSAELEDDGVEIFGKGLPKNRGLTCLILRNNYIGHVGVFYFSEGLKKNKTLKTLDLSNNPLRSKGGLTLANVLKTQRTLEKINLKDTYLRDDVGQVLSELTLYRTNLKSINLEMNPIDIKYTSSIQRNLSKNKNKAKRYLAPRLKNRIQKLKQEAGNILKITSKIELKKKEKLNITQRVEQTKQRLSEVQEDQLHKNNLIKEELQTLKSRSSSLDELLSNTQKKLQKETSNCTQVMNYWKSQLSKVNSEILQLEKTSKM